VNPFEREVAASATEYGLPLGLVLAVVQVESSFQPYAWKPEPPYRWFWDVRRNCPFRAPLAAEIASEHAPADFPTLAGHRDQEWWAQQASWGLMQVMGAVARERGFRGPYLPELTQPAVGLTYGCLHLRHLCQRHFSRHGWDGVFAAYNTGGPGHEPGSAGEAYVRKVRAIWNG